MSKDQVKIIERIKKLLRLADVNRGGTPAEVAAAAAKAQSLLLEHNLAVEDINLTEEAPEKISGVTVDLEASYLTSNWHGDLMHVISKPLFCRAIYHPAQAGRAGRVSLIGKPSNVAVVVYFYQYLYRTIDSMAVEYREGWKKKMVAKGEKFIPDESFRVRIDFCLGAVRTVGVRLAEQYKERTEKNATSRDLVVVSDQALDAAFNQAFPKKTKGTTKREIDISARLAGIVAGGRIPLNRGVGGGKHADQITN